MTSPLKKKFLSLADASFGMMYFAFAQDLNEGQIEGAQYHMGKAEVFAMMIEPDLGCEVYRAMLNEANRF